MLHITLQCLDIVFYSDDDNMMQAFQRVSCFEFFISAKMSHLTFANVFRVMNDEYSTHSKEEKKPPWCSGYRYCATSFDKA